MKKLRHNLAMVLSISLFAAYCGGRTDNANNAESGITGSGQASTPPTVNSLTPATDATGVYRDVAITITFSVVVNTATVTLPNSTNCTGAAIQLSTDGFATCIPMNQTVTQSGTQITVKAAGLLATTTPHSLRITTAVAGNTGLTMVTQHESSFTTGTTYTPLTGAFGSDCTSGADTVTDVRAGGDGDAVVTLVPARSVTNLTVTDIDKDGYFYVQSGATGPAVYVRDSSHRASALGVQTGDVVCITFAERDDYSNFQQVSSITAIQKTGAGSSLAAQVVSAAVTNDTYEAETVSVTGVLTTKSSSAFGGGYNHTFTYAGGTLTLREMDGSGKLTNFVQGQSIRVVAPMVQFGSGYQVYVDSTVGTITEYLNPTFTVSANATSATTVRLTFNDLPSQTAAAILTNYAGNNGLTISAVAVSGVTVTLTTSAQTQGQSYTITVTNVTRNADNAVLASGTPNFTGYTPPRLVISQVYAAGGNSGATYTHDYIEIFNPTSNATSLSGFSLQYGSATSTGSFANIHSLPNATIPAYSYYLIQCASGANGVALPVTANDTSCSLGLAATAGKIVLVNSTSAISNQTPTDAAVLDWVGYGSANSYEGSASAPSPSTTNAIFRGDNGCTDNNQNGSEFTAAAASPRNGSSSTYTCVVDTTAPTVGAPTITTASIADTSLTLNWTQATDNVTAQGALQYLVYRSAANNLGTVANIEANGTAIGSYATAIATLNVTGLTASTTYFFNIIVRDAAGNKSAYTAVSATTSAPDTTVPTVGTPTITTASVADTSLTLNWTQATDNVTAQGSLQYLAYRSSANNLDTVTNIEANGTAVGSYATAIATLNVTGLTASTTYYFNIIVRDAAGNKSAYTSVSAATTTPDTTNPTVGTPTITTANIAGTSLTLNWTQASDNVTATGALQYLAYRSTSNNLDTVANIESNGTAIGSYATAIATLNVTGLTASTAYYFNIIVRDAAGNKSAYTSVSATTGAGGATYLLQETFNYGGTGMNLTAVASSPWTAHSGAGTNAIQYNTTPLTMSGYCSGGGIGSATFVNGSSGEDVNRTFTQVTSGTLYVAALVNISNPQTAGDYFMHIAPTTIGSTFHTRVGARLNSGNLQFGLTRTTEAVVYDTVNNYTVGQTYLIVVKTTAINAIGTSQLFVLNAPTGTEPSAILTSASGTGTTSNYGSIAIRQGGTGTPSGKIGCMTVGTTWASLFE